MANLPPFMNAVGLIPKIIEKIAVAQQPSRFTQDFLGTKLGYSSGSAKAFIPLFKRIGMLQSDGTPTDLYSRLRNPNERGAAVAEAMRIGYGQIFERNEFAGSLPRDKLTNLAVEATGLARDSATLKAIVSSFLALAAFADFDAPNSTSSPRSAKPEPPPQIQRLPLEETSDRFGSYNGGRNQDEEVALNLAYTINLNLPESTNPEVFNAIFKALKENLLKK